MPTLDHYAYNIRNIARGGQGNSDDDRLNIRQIRFWINGYRASAIFQATDWGKDIDPQLVQDLGVVPFQEVDASDSSCPDVPWGCSVKKVVIPKLIDFPDLRALDFVGLINKQSEFIVNYANVASYKRDTKFGKLSSRAYLIGNTLYFILSKAHEDLEHINIRGVFEQPEEVFGYATEGCEPKCYDPSTDEYPMPARLYEVVLVSILRNELNWSSQAINDELNNARQDNAKIG
jgi:hypothetical protein